MNSIIMEGKVVGVLDNEFELSCDRFLGNNKDKSVFDCIAGENTIPIQTGDFIRAVGRLKKDHNKVYVYAEHIEIKRKENN